MNCRDDVVVLGLSNDTLGHTGGLVGLSLEGCTLNDIVELQLTCILTDDHSIERIPLADHVALLHYVTILEEQ